MKFRDRTEVVNKGEIIVVPKGVEHCPSTKDSEEVHILLFEKRHTAYTRAVEHETTQHHYPNNLNLAYENLTLRYKSFLNHRTV